jgi:F-type H+-transporting ATPase subunit delta
MDQRAGKNGMSGKRIVRRYAQALLQAAIDENRLDQVKADVEALDKIILQVPGVREYCEKKSLQPADAGPFCEIAFYPFIGPLTRNLIKILAANQALDALVLFKKAFEDLVSVQEGRINATVQSPKPMEPAILSELEKNLGRRLGKTVKIRTKLNPSLLGGFRILWDNRILDYSAAGRIKKLRAHVKNI